MNLKKYIYVSVFGGYRYTIQKIKRACLVQLGWTVCNRGKWGGRGTCKCDLWLYKRWKATQKHHV